MNKIEEIVAEINNVKWSDHGEPIFDLSQLKEAMKQYAKECVEASLKKAASMFDHRIMDLDKYASDKTNRPESRERMLEYSRALSIYRKDILNLKNIILL